MPEAAPNPVYLRTQQGLAAFVSATAATRVLDKALADAGVSPERVRARQMRALLLGPVLDELDRILPRSGLERNLEALAAALDDGRPPPEPVSVGARTVGSLPGSAQVARNRTARVISGVRTELIRSRPNTEADLKSAVLELAAIDNVTLVAAVRANGETVFARGAGDVASLARLGRLALSLLLKSGPLRIFFVATETSSLLLFPWGSDALLLTGKPELNVGAVVTSFTDLVRNKEET